MPYARRRPHLHNRRQTLQLTMEAVPLDLWFPEADEPIVIDDFPAAVSMVDWLSDGPINDAALVLLDEHRQITSVILDPVPGVCFFPGMIDGPGFEVDFANTLLVMFPDDLAEVDDGEMRQCYETMRKHHALQGLLLLDIVVVHDNDVRSSSIAYDRDSVWFEAFQPIEPIQPIDPSSPCSANSPSGANSPMGSQLGGGSIDDTPTDGSRRAA